MARYFGFCQTPRCSPTWKRGFAEDYVRIFGGSGRTGTTVFNELRRRGVSEVQ